MSVEYLVGDVFDRLEGLGDGSVDLVVTSPPFLALRSYLPADHPDKGKEIGSEATPAEFLDTMLRVTQELRRVLAPHGSIAIELGDTYVGSGGAGGDYNEHGIRAGQPRWDGSVRRGHGVFVPGKGRLQAGEGWPLPKSKALIPQLFEVALAYGINSLTGAESPAGQWRIRNVVTWARPNPPVGALGDKWRPATSDVIVACLSVTRYWDDIATRREHVSPDIRHLNPDNKLNGRPGDNDGYRNSPYNPTGAPLLDYWEIPPGGYRGAHYAVFPAALVEPLIKAMAPPKVCRQCGEPSRRIVENGGYERNGEPVDDLDPWPWGGYETGRRGDRKSNDGGITARLETAGWTDCGHDDWRPGVVLDPFAGTGTTLHVAEALGRDAVGIDIDGRNQELYEARAEEPAFMRLRQETLL